MIGDVMAYIYERWLTYVLAVFSWTAPFAAASFYPLRDGYWRYTQHSHTSISTRILHSQAAAVFSKFKCSRDDSLREVTRHAQTQVQLTCNVQTLPI
jgi:hypothetical protein